MGIGMLVVGESRTVIAMGIGSAIQQLGAGMAINAMIYWVVSVSYTHLTLPTSDLV